MASNPRLTTILTLCGVLVAGTAAAAVNSSVLSDRGRPQSAASATVSSEQDGGTVVDSSPTSSSAVQPELIDDGSVTYEVGDAGSVVVRVDDDGDELTVRSATANDGWQVVHNEDDHHRATVVFVGPTLTVTFTASVLRGVVSTDVTSADVTSTDVVSPASIAASDDDSGHRSGKSDDDHGSHGGDDDD